MFLGAVLCFAFITWGCLKEGSSFRVKHKGRSSSLNVPKNYLKPAALGLSAVENNFEKDFLEAHNNYRALHGVPPLKLDSKLSDFAQGWADHLAKNNEFDFRPDNPYGENLVRIRVSSDKFLLGGKIPVKTWYDEIKLFKFGSQDPDLDAGQFTQVVWKNSKYLGVGAAKNGKTIIVVANYDPEGNIYGEYTENVPPIVSKGKSGKPTKGGKDCSKN